jgi:hypothetical protein
MPAHQNPGQVLRSQLTTKVFRKDAPTHIRSIELPEDVDFQIQTRGAGLPILHFNYLTMSLAEFVEYVTTNSATTYDLLVEQEAENPCEDPRPALIPSNLVSGYYKMTVPQFGSGNWVGKFREVQIKQGDKVVLHVYLKAMPYIESGELFLSGKRQFAAVQAFVWEHAVAQVAEAKEIAFCEVKTKDVFELGIEQGKILEINGSNKLSDPVMAGEFY